MRYRDVSKGSSVTIFERPLTSLPILDTPEHKCYTRVEGQTQRSVPFLSHGVPRCTEIQS